MDLSLGMGNPNSGEGTFGICVARESSQYLQVSNTYYHLEPADRDPRGGLQVLFCKFGEAAGMALRHYKQAFSEAEVAVLMQTARAAGFGAAAYMEDGEILQRYSTTPEWEPRWFCDRVREAARLVGE